MLVSDTGSIQPEMGSEAIDIPPPPSLVADSIHEETNTHALILPHQSLFLPSILTMLRRHYESFGPIAHWAPVRGFGRVIIVWETIESADRAKRLGDYLKLDVDLPAEEGHEEEMAGRSESPTDLRGLPRDGSGRTEWQINGSSGASPGGSGGSSSSSKRGHRRRKSKGPVKGITLRLHPMPFTPLNLDSSANHLAPPHLEKNFLISPPGSPPEGWEPVVEEPPNAATLADDLARALEAVQVNGRHRRMGSKEIILEEGGMRVEVEDCTNPNDDQAEPKEWEGVEEMVMDNEELWRLPGQDSITRIAPTSRLPM